jgi:hypothetical protein
MPTGLYVPAAFGDPFALATARQTVAAAHLPLFDQRMADLRRRIAALPEAAWFDSMAAAQLRAASFLCAPRDDRFPHYMRSPWFAARNAESVLGSWTELKHDTVLYAKQAYAELGEGGDPHLAEPPPPSRGFVQPDVPFWRAMERLARFAADGFARHRLLPDAAEEYSALREFARDTAFCRRLAEQEIAGAAIARADYDKLASFSLAYMDAPLEPDQTGSPERGQTALVTDVFTDAVSMRVLHQALGAPCVMVALVGSGRDTRLVAGPAYRHFEFTRPLGTRMTDEEWRRIVYQNAASLPPRAKWAAPVHRPRPAGGGR